MTPRRLRARILATKPSDGTQGEFEALVGQADLQYRAREAMAEPEGLSRGLLSFMGASQSAVDRALKAAEQRAALEWTAASAAEREAQNAAKALRKAALTEAVTPWDGTGEAYHDAREQSEPPPPRLDLRAVEHDELRRFEKAERKRVTRDDPNRPSARGERIVGLVKDLDQPRVVRDFDAEIAALLRTVGGAS